MLSTRLAFQQCPVGDVAANDFRTRLVGAHAGFADGIRPMFPPPMVDEPTEAGFVHLLERLALIFKAFLHRVLERNGVDATLQALGYCAHERQLLGPCCTPAGLVLADALTRFDVLHCADGLRVVELNAAAGIGGIGLIEAYDQAMTGSAFERCLADDGWRATSRHPLDRVEQLLRRLVGELQYGPTAGAEIHVVVAVQSRDLDYQQTAVCARYLTRDGIRVTVATLDEVEDTPQGVRLRSDPVHVIWAVHSFEAERIDTGLRERASAMRSAAAQGRVAYLVPPSASVLGNKALLALLQQQSGQALLDPADRDLVTLTIPDTCLVTPDVLERLVSNQAQLILKPARGGSGTGILFGTQVSSEAWRLGLERIVHSGVAYVAQHLCLPKACDVPDGRGGTKRINVVLGGICVDGAYAGHLVRALDAESIRPINVASGGIMAPCYVLSRSANSRRI